MAIKFAKDIAKAIRERESIQLPENCVSGEAFEKWLCEGYERRADVTNEYKCISE